MSIHAETHMYWLDRRLLARSLPWLLFVTALGAGAVFLMLGAGALAVSVGWIVALLLPAAATSQLGSCRLAMAFVIAACLALPTGAGWLAGALVLLLARGDGRALAEPGLRRGGLFAVAVAQLAAAAGLPDPLARPGSALVAAAMLSAILALLPRAVARAARGAPEAVAGLRRQDLAAEAAAAPLALLLARAIVARSPLDYMLAAASIVFAAWLMGRLRDARLGLERVRHFAARREVELATLHALGREIAPSTEPQRLLDVVERECRKLFEVDAFLVARCDGDTTRIEVARVFGSCPTTETRRLDRGVAPWVAVERRPLRIDDLASSRWGAGQDPLLGSASRSLLAAPMVADGRVQGIVALQSNRPGTYDDGDLHLLTTIARQAAAGLEAARHYERATIDSLTGLYLRDYFFRRVREEYGRIGRYGGDFAVLMLDLDQFKTLNDRHGHFAGDRYLEAVGALIRDRLRQADLGCRYGGDEFCLLLPETDLEGASAIAERLRRAIGGLALEVEGCALRTTVSIGVASCRRHDPGSLHGLLRNADQALYKAKRAGRDRVVPYAA